MSGFPVNMAQLSPETVKMIDYEYPCVRYVSKLATALKFLLNRVQLIQAGTLYFGKTRHLLICDSLRWRFLYRYSAISSFSLVVS